ncbi:MAG: response regulator [Pseudomonadales bacterium]|nr:response regulator [Pseudomonadales bacterium]
MQTTNCIKSYLLKRIAPLLGGYLLLLLLSTYSVPGYAQQADRILILYSAFRNENWVRDFDRAFSEALSQAHDSQIESSAQFLGLLTPLPPASRERLKRNVESTITEQGVDLVVAVQHGASEFYSELNDIDHLPAVFVLPGENVNLDSLDSSRVRVVESAWREALTTTVTQILAMRPQTNTIEVLAGNNDIDLFYLAGMQEIAEGYVDRVDFNYLAGAAPDRILTHVEQLPQTSALMLLSMETFGPDRQTLQTALISYFIEEATVPSFGMYDSAIDLGVVGGHLTSVDSYAQAAVAHAMSLLELSTANPEPLGGAISVYNWEELNKWNLSVDDLPGDINVVNIPPSFVEENLLLTIVVTNVFLLFVVLLVFQAILLKRSRTANSKILDSEQQARSSEEKYRLLESNIADVIWNWDEGNDYLKYCSASAKRLTGYTSEEYLQLSIQNMMTKESVTECQKVFKKDSNDTQIVEIELYKKEGGTINAEMVVQRSLKTVDGKCEWTGVTRDITQRIQDDLDRQALEEQRRQAQKFESLGTLAGGIAHDFNNILGVIFGVSDLLKEEYEKDSKASKLLNKLVSASDKARTLVQQILTFSRGSKGQSSVFEFSSVLKDCVDLVVAGNPNTIKLKMRNKLPKGRVYADKTQIEQVVINILTNAIEASKTDYPRIEIRVTESVITEMQKSPYGTLGPGKYLRLCICDDGIGIDKEALNRVFDPFYTSKELGSGMGLAIVHSIVIDHGGAVNLKSEKDEGTTMEVFLPLVNAELSTADEPSITPLLTNESKRILLVDDNEELLNVLEDMLKHLGHECISCKDPTKAIALIDESIESVDLIITDYSMPEVSGLDIVAHCAKNYPTMPVILSTGYGDALTKNFASELGAIGLLNKPFTLTTLSQTLDEFSVRAAGEYDTRSELRD